MTLPLITHHLSLNRSYQNRLIRYISNG